MNKRDNNKKKIFFVLKKRFKQKAKARNKEIAVNHSKKLSSSVKLNTKEGFKK
jgi:hypothetical protein